MAARSFLALVADRRNAARLSIGLACGLRQGEALGQRWHYVNLDSGELRVWFQLQRLPWRHGCPDVAACTERWDRRPCPRRRPKSLPKSGRPQVCIPELVTVLKAHREVQDLERETAANLWQDHDVVFARKDGLLIDLQRTCASGQPWAQAGIPHAGTHTMRHSAATIALDEGVALAVVQEMLGHSGIRVTRGYTHVSSLLAQDAATKLGQRPVRGNCCETAAKADDH